MDDIKLYSAQRTQRKLQIANNFKMLGTDVFALSTAYIATKSTNLMSAKFLLTVREIRSIIWSTGNADRRLSLRNLGYKKVAASVGTGRLLFCVEKRDDQCYNDAKHREHKHENLKRKNRVIPGFFFYRSNVVSSVHV